MTRINQLPENATVEKLKYIRSELDNIKKRQLTGGDNLLTYMNVGPNIVKSISAYDTPMWRITFEPISGKKTYNQLDVLASATNPSGFETYIWFVDPATEGTNEIAWILYFVNDSNAQTLSLQNGFRALETGEVTWEEL